MFNTRVTMPNHPNSWGAVEFNSLFPAYPLFNYRQGLTVPVCFRHLCGSYFEGRPRRSRQLLHCSSERVGCQNQFFDCFVLVSKHTLDRRATSIVRHVLAPHHGQAIRGDLFDYYVGSFGVFHLESLKPIYLVGSAPWLAHLSRTMTASERQAMKRIGLSNQSGLHVLDWQLYQATTGTFLDSIVFKLNFAEWAIYKLVLVVIRCRSKCRPSWCLR